MMQTQPAKGVEIEVGRSLLPKLHLAYFRTVPQTGALELYVKTEAGLEFVQPVSDDALRSHLKQLQNHILDRLPQTRGR